MENFTYYIPTKILFGKNQTEKLGKEISSYGKKVLFLYGKNSIKKNGVYDDVVNSLAAHNISFVELSGVDPNPRIETVKRGAELCREHNLDLVLAVGGGSTIDCAKAIAAQAKYDGDVWQDLYVDKKLNKLTSALPVATVLTLAATGSEMNGNSVISNPETDKKLSISSNLLRPVVSV
ncbi:MAG: iron-containing alcohol dehydrogenase, partial [Cetobacterium sp.]